MKKIMFMFLAMAVAGTSLGVTPTFSAEQTYLDGKKQPAAVTKLADLKAGLRDLWIGHAFWVRNVVVSIRLGDNAAAEVAEGEVIANARAIAGAIEPFYGKAASDQLFGLLAEHYGAVKEYMSASYFKYMKGQDIARDKLVANADAMAVFLNGANANLPRETLQGLLTAHAGHHMMQIDALNTKSYAEESRVWNDMKSHMYVIADTLAVGLAKQFPKMIR